MMTKPSKFAVVLIADDDPDDRLMIQEAFEERCGACSLYFVQDGVEALGFLRSDCPEATPAHPGRLPDLILLDLNMPLKDGRETLREIKSDPLLQAIPTIILTTSRDEDDRASCNQQGASGYFIKPTRYSDLLELAAILKRTWIDPLKPLPIPERYD